MLLIGAKAMIGNFELAHLKKEEINRFWPFGDFAVWYIGTQCFIVPVGVLLAMKHSKINVTLL